LSRHGAFGKEIVDVLAWLLRHVSGEHVIEAAVLADDDDDVLDGGMRDVVARAWQATGKCRPESELPQRQCT